MPFSARISGGRRRPRRARPARPGPARARPRWCAADRDRLLCRVKARERPGWGACRAAGRDLRPVPPGRRGRGADPIRRGRPSALRTHFTERFARVSRTQFISASAERSTHCRPVITGRVDGGTGNAHVHTHDQRPAGVTPGCFGAFTLTGTWKVVLTGWGVLHDHSRPGPPDHQLHHQVRIPWTIGNIVLSSASYFFCLAGQARSSAPASWWLGVRTGYARRCRELR
jgi:hypothetical protein